MHRHRATSPTRLPGVDSPRTAPPRLARLSWLPRRRFLGNKVAQGIFYQFVLCALLPLSVLTYFALDRVGDQLTRDSYRQLRDTGRVASVAVEERLKVLESDLGALQEFVQVDDPDFGALEEHYRQRFHWIAIDSEDAGLRSILGEAEKLPVLDGDELAHLRRTGVVLVSRPGTTAVREVCMVRRMPGRGMRVQVYAHLRDEYLWGREGPMLASSGPVMVVDDEGPLFAYPDEMASNVSYKAAIRDNPVTGRLRWQLDDEQFVGSYWTMFAETRYSTSWTILCGASLADTQAPVKTFLFAFAFVLAVTFLSVVVLGGSQITRCLRPIDELMEATQRITDEDYETRVEIEREDEFGLLGDRFNTMTERIRERTDQLTRANLAKSAFLANMSHEIRTPMTSIIGYADLLKQDPDLEESTRRDYVQVIGSSGRHLLTVINEILDVSKIESGEMEPETEVCSAAAVASEAVWMLRGRAEEKGIALRLENDGPIPETIVTDPSRLRQILLNLLGNAIKFTHEGSVRVVLSAGTGDDGADQLSIAVVDTGIGIPTEKQQVIFEPFRQADGSMSRLYGGTGLGLSISRALARLLGGDVTCSSTPGLGSRFTLTIDPGPLEGVALLDAPFAEQHVVTHESEPDAPENVDARVLLVEDVAVNRVLVAKLLARAGIEVEQAEHGQVAFEQALAAQRRGEPYDVVLMDMQMPVMDGYTATRELRRHGYKAPIVALTSHSIEGERERCIEAGCDEFANKPIDGPAVVELVRRFARQRPRQSA